MLNRIVLVHINIIKLMTGSENGLRSVSAAAYDFDTLALVVIVGWANLCLLTTTSTPP